MKSLKQPGRASQPRRVIAAAVNGGEFRVRLAPGQDLTAGLVSAFSERGIRGAAVMLLGGEFSEMQYLTGQPDASGARVATYGAPTKLTGTVLLLGGNAIFGRDAEGGPLLHCHAVLVDGEGGVHGGHLPPGVCIVGAAGISAQVTVLEQGEFAVAYDAETNYSIFGPRKAPELSEIDA